MVRVLPVNLPYNIKTLWFDPGELEVHAGDDVVVNTARGVELGKAASDVIEVEYERVKKLKSPLKSVERVATAEDVEKAAEMERLAKEAMPIFKEMARETSEDMHPVSVEYLLEGDKAVFYFESEERVDFRDLVRKLAAKFHVRVDMRQIGVRDEARIIGGIGHCGQMICCKRLGGEFNPVSIRMAKDQDLSLNPQKISGLCGRLMCCLRYENDAYKDFKSRAPKVGALISTPEGEAKVDGLDVPLETVTLRIGDEKPIKVPLDCFEKPEEGKRPTAVDPDCWEKITAEGDEVIAVSSTIFQTSQFTGMDKLGSASVTHNERSSSRSNDPLAGRGKGSSKSNKQSKQSKQSGRRGSSHKEEAEDTRKKRRRSTKISGGKAERVEQAEEGSSKPQGKSDGGNNGKQKKPSRQRGSKGSQRTKSSSVRPGQKSSGLSRDNDGQKKRSSSNASSKPQQKRDENGKPGEQSPSRRRRRSRKRSNGGASNASPSPSPSSSGGSEGAQ